MDFERMRRARMAQLAEDGEATAVPMAEEARMRAASDSGDNLWVGGLAVLAFVAMLTSGVLVLCRLCGDMSWPVVWLLAPIWGTGLVIALVGGVFCLIERLRAGSVVQGRTQ